jgi:hypothetical protein
VRNVDAKLLPCVIASCEIANAVLIGADLDKGYRAARAGERLIGRPHLNVDQALGDSVTP